MHWSTINPVLIQLFTDIAVEQIKTVPDDPDQPPYNDPLVTPEWRAAWKERRQELIHPGQGLALYLKVTSCVGVGDDENRYEMQDTGLAAGGDASNIRDVIETQCGNRRFTVQVQALVAEDDDQHSAMGTLERIRTRISRQRYLDQLLAVNVALVDILPAINAAAKFDARVWSVGNMDVVFAAAVNDQDPIPVGWIQYVELTSRLRDEGGQLLPSPPNVTDEWIPPLP